MIEATTHAQLVERLRATRRVVRTPPFGVMTDLVILDEAADALVELTAAYRLACAQRDKLSQQLVRELAK